MMSRAQTEGEAAGEKANRKSALPSERGVLLVLCALLAAALIIIYRLSFVILVSSQSVQSLKEDNEALRTNLSETKTTWTKQPTCPPPPSCPRPPSCPPPPSGPPPPESHSQTCLKCGRPWELHRGKCYYISNTTSSWQDSRSLCRDLGGDLVKISSREEQEFLTRGRDFKTPEMLYWIGLTDSETEARWLWVDGSPLDTRLSFWDAGEPNNVKSLFDDGEHCASLNVTKTDGGLNTWNDQSCAMSNRITCEKSAEYEQISCV